MKLNKVIFTEEHVIEITNWKYEGEYSIYNLPSWNEIKKNNLSLAKEDKRKNFISFIDDNKELIGFINLLDKGSSVFFGIGIKPDYCGMGIGKEIISLSLEECRNKYSTKPVVLEVRTWNKRAVKCYESQGFKIVETKIQKTYLGDGEFFVMRYK
ncbi:MULTISPECIES: GNAT family N-acetyltransferase [Clostridioides]|uniref:GNAT family N-acetyltransferase n=1 Tax=Clostridioides sp. ZZV14-6387 TaxID=2811497 RepID=UPI0007BBD0A5|nr:GNAT family N-acetyltransferase [Clostridioides sp. ZZV14-6387]MDB3084011.1 N-acetyltransferase [Clostridioides difficile]MDI0266575.1 GNAT family N-acetyltransferase [Clostridioides difficile]CZR95994.1 putative acetyltransferase [Clostridioides difficile]CZS06635.1 putative acetyltransferase [Clostridioides difficile]